MSINPTILLIQFRSTAITADLERDSITRELGKGVSVRTISALDGTQLWADPVAVLGDAAAVIFGGSGDFDFDGNRDDTDPAKAMSYQFLAQLTPLISYIFERDLPTLGICYGHQLLGAYAGVPVLHDPVQSKTKSHDVEVLVDIDGHALFAGMPKKFPAQYGHKDVLAHVPTEAVLLIHGGESCRVSALQYQNNIYTMQFHPELSVDDMRKRMEATPGYLPDGVVIEEIFIDSPDAHRILKNFGTFVVHNNH
jgi:GMP synthase-like glutamine amidotransferase